MTTSRLAPASRNRSDGPLDRAACPLAARRLSRKMDGRQVLRDVDVAIGASEVVAIVGANGCGKTTLLRSLAGRLRPTSGEVLWFGTSPFGRPQTHRLIGFAGHETALYLELTADENLLFAARMHGLPDPRRRVAEMLTQADLLRQACQPAGRLSQGQKQRLSLARALIHDPPIVILDEPFASLDCAGRAWLEAYLAELRDRHRAIIFSSHDDAQCHRIARRTLVLIGGRLTCHSSLTAYA